MAEHQAAIGELVDVVGFLQGGGGFGEGADGAGGVGGNAAVAGALG